VPPVLGGEIRKRQQDLALLGQALGRFRILAFLGGDKQSKGHLGTLAVRRQPDRLEALFGLRLEGFRQFVEPGGRLLHPTPLPAALGVHVAERFPKTQRPSPNGQGWPVFQPATFEIEQKVFPGLLTLPVAIPEADQLLVTTRGGAQNDQDTGPSFLQAALAVDALTPDIAIPFTLEAATLPLRQCLVPALLQPAEGRWGEPRRLWPSEGLERLREIPRRDAFQVQPREQSVAAFRLAHIGWEERRVQANPAATAIPHVGHLDAHRTNPRVPLTLRKGAIADHPGAALGIAAVGILC
jgi:hypothetical protein